MSKQQADLMREALLKNMAGMAGASGPLKAEEEMGDYVSPDQLSKLSRPGPTTESKEAPKATEQKKGV
jgi:hypothetical protein